MRNIVVSILATLLLIVLTLAVVPVFLSTDFLKTQVEQFVQKQSGLVLDIGGDVSLTFLTGLKLSAEQVSLKEENAKQLFSVERLDFSLALRPLLSGKADVTGITLNRPVLSINKASSGNTAASGQAAPRTIPFSEAEQTAQSSPKKEIDLSALKLRRLTIREGELVSIDDEENAQALLTGLDATLRIPDFTGPAELEATLPYNGQALTVSGTIARVGEAINGRTSGLDLDLSNDLLKAKLVGSLALNANQKLVANYAANVGNVTQFLKWLEVDASTLDVGEANLQGSLIATDQEIALPALELDLDKQSLKAAARIFTADAQKRPLIRLALDASTFNIDAILQKNADSSSTPQAGKAGEDISEGPDLSLLTTFDASLDMRAGRLTYQGKSISGLKLLAHVIDGTLQADLKSVNLAQGTLSAHINGDVAQLLWNGSIAARSLDIKALADLAEQTSPLTGNLSADLNFAAQGLNAKSFANRGNLAGSLALEKGQIRHPALQAAVPNRETGSLSNLSARVAIANLDDPADISGQFTWNGEAIRFASQFGLGQAIGASPIPASLSFDSSPLSLAISGNVDPTRASLSGSRLSFKTQSSKRLLTWLGQPVSSGTPNMPLTLAGRLAIAPQKTSLSDLSLQMGQSKGSGKIEYASTGKPKLSGALAFDKLDVTPFLGNGAAQGQSAGGAKQGNSASGWDETPIDFSGLNTLNADLTLSTQSLIARDIVTGPVTLITKLTNGRLDSELQQLRLYSGQGNGQIAIDAKSTPAQMAANFALSGLKMKPFLKDAISLDSLAGTGAVNLKLTAAGASQAQIINQLDGTGTIAIADGQIHGINIPLMLRSLNGNILNGWASSETQSTDFSALTASLTFNKGVVTNPDLSMLSPLIRLTGAGTIDLPNKRINYKTEPKVVSKLQGQGGPVNAEGIPIPILIKGSLNQPRIYPDIPGILENPQAILKGLQQLGPAGNAASQGVKKVEKKVRDEIKKQTDRLGIDLNKLIAPQQDGTKNPSADQQLFNNITKGLFGN